MNYTKLLNYLWRAGESTDREFVAATGEHVSIISQGEPSDDTPEVWLAAQIVVDGERRCGAVVVGAETPVPDGAVLRVVEAEELPVLGMDNRLIPQIVFTPSPQARQIYDTLRAGAAAYACAPTIARLDPLRRTELFTGLLVERLQRKTARITQIFEGANRDWNQTFHVMLLSAMGGDRNREAFVALAGKATAAMVSREKGSLFRVEALLLGAAGFLFGDGGGRGKNSEFDDKDDYTRRLEDEARHLLAKYSITPLKPAEWDLDKLYPANHPAVRLVEIAALVCKKDFMFDGMLSCRTSGDVESLFAASASEYWRTHHTLSGAESRAVDKTIGRAKARLVGINLVAPLMFAYGRDMGAEELCERALDLLATIPAEKNRLLTGWYGGGCVAESGFDSQALLQLGVEYCASGRCADCRLGRREIKKALMRSTSV